MESRSERLERFANMYRKSRAEIGMSQEKLAMELGVSRKTIQNWEMGISSPSFFQSSEWFRVLGVNPLPYYFDFVFPNEPGGKDMTISDDEVEKRLIEHIQNMPSNGKRALLYALYGEHGSSPMAIFQLLLAHLHCPMKDRVGHASLIMANYMMEKSVGGLVGTNHILPDEELLKESIEKGIDAVMNNSTGYSH